MFTNDRKPSVAPSAASKSAAQRPANAPSVNPLWSRPATSNDAASTDSPELTEKERLRYFEPLTPSFSGASWSRIGHVASGADVEAGSSIQRKCAACEEEEEENERAEVGSHTMAVSAPGDPQERQADELADQVMRMAEPRAGDSVFPVVPGTSATSDEKEIRRAPEAHDGGGARTGLDARTALRAAARGGEPLSQEVRAFFEPRFGRNLDGVRVRVDGEAADAVQARAYTVGRNIVFGRGEYAPDTTEGQRLIAHELAHVVQAAPGIARESKSGAPLPCAKKYQDGSAKAYPQDTSRYPSGRYVIWGTFHDGIRDIESSARETADNWIRWRFKSLSSAVASRIQAEFLAQQWEWRADASKAADGCQYYLDMPMAMMERLVALASRDVGGVKAEEREKQAGMPDLPTVDISPGDEEVAPGGGSDGGRSAQETQAPEEQRKTAADRALDPSSVYQQGREGATHPPFPARLEGPQQEVVRGIGTYRMVLDYAATTADPLMQIAYHMNYVQYHWELFDITQLVKNSLGKAGEQEAARTSVTAARLVKAVDVLREEEKKARSTPMDPNAHVGTLGAAERRAENLSEQLAQEEQTARAQLRDPASAAEGGSAVDVVTRYIANELNLSLLDVSALVAAGGISLGALSDLLAGPSSEQEVPFPNREGYFMIRCIAQPAPRGPEGSERRAASVATRIVQVRKADIMARDVLGEPEAAIAELQLQKELARTEDEKARIEEKIQDARLEATGDVVELLGKRLEAKKAEWNAATGYRKARLEKEVEQLQLRYDQAREKRTGTVGLHYRPRTVFVSQVTGETYPLLLDLSELPVAQGKRVRLMDLTRPDSAPIDRNGATLEDAVRNAFRELGSHGGLGRGTLAIRMPANFPGNLPEYVLNTADENTAVVKRRLQELASALLVLGLFVPGLGEVSAVIAAALAAEKIIERALNGTLRVDAEFVSDALAVLGAAAQGAQYIGKLRVMRSGNAFVAAAKEADLAGLVKAAEAFEAARKTGETLNSLSTLVNMGGLMWGNLMALQQLAELSDQELAGMSHSEARRRRAEILLGALRDNSIMFVGIARARKAIRESEGKAAEAAEGRRAADEGAAPKEKAREGERIPESELKGRVAENDPSARPAKDRVRARFPTPDGLHEIFVLEDGRIFRCSSSCAEMRTWYDSFLQNQSDDARKALAKSLDAELKLLEDSTRAGQNTKEVNDAIAALDVRMRDFIAPDLAKELTASAVSSGMEMIGAGDVLTEAQTRRLLTFLDINTIRSLVGPGGLKDAQALRRFANRPEAVLREFRRVADSYGTLDTEAMHGLMATVSNNKYSPPMLEAGYKQASELKVKYGERISGEILERCVRAAGAADAPQAQAELALAIDILEGRTSFGTEQRLHGLEEGTTRRPEYAVTADGKPRRLAEVKRLQGAPGAPLKEEQMRRNLQSALGQLREESRPGDAPGMVRLDGRAAGPTALNEPEVRAMVARSVRNAVVPDPATGQTSESNVGFVEILYNDAAGRPARMLFPVTGTTVGEAK
ncbi:DUF4157 domain-containing protein [Vitiosangium sp. GDMCC 1.1324]|uniref:eCIS core domain-containing protein n=1 Tax=Vitiosangium sp. (strain GDMCC 1.1324) TaxID=2138576 RepID=UPI000D37D222|nr:DUF4157 domain-containing protein [Vitiosangium sp. GDMCC 1.1324]PTL78083.1 hypothetical protein DAT35_41450 [Vitiosangium sp. GDMCC 1.1324]